MSFHTSCVCDGCEKHLDADNEDDELAAEWLIVKYGDPEDPTSRDFCSARCALKWLSRGALDLPDPAEGIALDGDDTERKGNR